jgi:hypothetical protein
LAGNDVNDIQLRCAQGAQVSTHPAPDPDGGERGQVKTSSHLAHIIPMRRCNLSCAYCNEYDKVSDPVPTEEVLRRIDKLATLGTGIITISGGEPLLHPGLDVIIRAIRSHRAIATIIQWLPADPGPYSTAESRRPRSSADLDRQRHAGRGFKEESEGARPQAPMAARTRAVRRQHQFCSGGMAHPEDALTITRRALQLGFDTTVGIIHDHDGQLEPLKEDVRAVYDQILKERKSALFAFVYDTSRC